jgi:hypothetical protein
MIAVINYKYWQYIHTGRDLCLCGMWYGIDILILQNGTIHTYIHTVAIYRSLVDSMPKYSYIYKYRYQYTYMVCTTRSYTEYPWYPKYPRYPKYPSGTVSQVSLVSWYGIPLSQVSLVSLVRGIPGILVSLVSRYPGIIPSIYSKSQIRV